MTTEMKLPAGFTSRPPVMADVPIAVDLLNLAALEMIGNPETTTKEIETEWSTPGLDPEKDQRLIFSPDGTLVGYIELWAIHDNPVHPWVWGRVHPDYKGLGLGTAMLAWAEARAQHVLEIVEPDARVSFRCNAPDNFKPSNQLLAGYGMDLIRHSFQMRIQLTEKPPAPAWPDGIAIRTYQPGDIEAVYRTDDEAFADHFGHVPEDFETGLARFSHFFLEGEHFDPELWFLAFDGDDMAAVCLCRAQSWEDETIGWVSSLAVRRPWRKRGLGLALLHHSFNAFRERGKQGVGLGVDAQNLTGALNLYKKAGMSVHRQYNLYEKELRAGKELATISAGD